jgi:hypothetical protein
MALDNLISVVLSDEDLAVIDAALTNIELIVAKKAVNLTPRQRQAHGRVAYEMEEWVNKTSTYMVQDPTLVPPYIDMVEYTADLKAHKALNPIIERMNSIFQSVEDTNRLLGSDIYTNSMAYYRNLREAAKVNAVGATPKYNDLKRQFPGGGSKKTTATE